MRNASCQKRYEFQGQRKRSCLSPQHSQVPWRRISVNNISPFTSTVCNSKGENVYLLQKWTLCNESRDSRQFLFKRFIASLGLNTMNPRCDSFEKLSRASANRLLWNLCLPVNMNEVHGIKGKTVSNSFDANKSSFAFKWRKIRSFSLALTFISSLAWCISQNLFSDYLIEIMNQFSKKKNQLFISWLLLQKRKFHRKKL